MTETEPNFWQKLAADKRFPIYLLLAMVVGIMVVFSYLGWTGLLSLKTEQLTPDKYGQLFANLFITAVIVERFIEIFNSIFRRRGRLERVRNLERAKESNAARQIKTAQEELDTYRTRTETLAMYLGFIVGILVSFAGLRTLGIVFDPAELAGMQKTLFWTMDILLTAGLIAGGSKGINGITTIIGGFLEKSKEQITEPPQAPNPGTQPPPGGAKP